MQPQAVAEEKGLPKRANLWNRGDKTFSQECSGELVTIEPGKYVEMARRKAIEVRGMFLGKGVKVSLELEPILDGEREEPITDANPLGKVFTCPYCDKEFPGADGKAKLKGHLMSHSKDK